MGRPIDQRMVMAYSASFKKVPILRERGFAVLVKVSGQLFKKAMPTLKDVEGNTEAWATPKYPPKKIYIHIFKYIWCM